MTPFPRRVVLSCEHATCRVPPGLSIDPEVLRSHVGFDEGALAIAEGLAEAWSAPLVVARWSRLWVDCNRSHDAPNVVPTVSFGVEVPGNRGADLAERLVAWRAFRDEASRRLQAALRVGPVLHLSVHTFEPRLDPARTYPVGLLYDPDRPAEVEAVHRMAAALEAAGFETRHNEPYLGVDDGHTTACRLRWPDPDYAGVELEVARPVAVLRGAEVVRALARLDGLVLDPW
jgi:predicted N-formylglutamate amidohydrolase